MINNDSKTLIIDACVARSASENQKPVSTNCRELLSEVLKSNHKLGFTNELSQEWKKHNSKFSALVLATLIRRNRVLNIEGNEDSFNFRTKVAEIKDKARIPAISKDLHLVEAALLTDKIVLSSDTNARGHFSVVLDDFPELSDVMWLNPVSEEDSVVSWLLQGCKTENNKMLKSYIVS
ncbi:hypothetical protein ABER68_18345 [Paenibacillus alvei]